LRLLAIAVLRGSSESAVLKRFAVLMRSVSRSPKHSINQ
jgi:hypothetical protein